MQRYAKPNFSIFIVTVHNISCGKVVFTPVCDSVHRGCLNTTPGRQRFRHTSHPLGRQRPRQKHPLGRHPLPDSHFSGRYASHWNAFLFINKFSLLVLCSVEIYQPTFLGNMYVIEFKCFDIHTFDFFTKLFFKRLCLSKYNDQKRDLVS